LFERLWSFGFDDSALWSVADSSDVLLTVSAAQSFALPAILLSGMMTPIRSMTGWM
jgi:hypothetical protein